jgi:hypothetical protein
MKKIITLLSFAIIPFISSDLKAQNIVTPTTITQGVDDYYYYVNLPSTPSTFMASDAFWFTDEQSANSHEGNAANPESDFINYFNGNNEMYFHFSTPGYHHINVYYGGWSNLSASVSLMVWVN